MCSDHRLYRRTGFPIAGQYAKGRGGALYRIKERRPNIPIAKDHTDSVVVHLLKDGAQDFQPRMFANMVAGHNPMILIGRFG